MTKLLERAIAEANKLSSKDQDALASILLEEIEDDVTWEQKFERTQGQLSRLADKVRADIQKGRVTEMGIDEL
ncbi:MAG: hypothetical protein QM703_09290 [Gemmatales bacterium]